MNQKPYDGTVDATVPNDRRRVLHVDTMTLVDDSGGTDLFGWTEQEQIAFLVVAVRNLDRMLKARV